MSISSRIASAVAEFFLLALLALVPFIAVYLDIVVIGHRIGEVSVTEIAQEALLLLTVLVFLYSAWRQPASRGFLVLVAGFFAAAFIRELDGFLDEVWHGFWVWPAMLVSLTSISYAAIRCRDTVFQPMADFIDTKPYYFIVMGLIVLLVFSRTFGSGNMLWNDLLGSYAFKFKTVVQEGLELFGYLFIAYGAYNFLTRRER